MQLTAVIVVLDRWDLAHLMVEMMVNAVVLVLWMHLKYLRCRMQFSFGSTGYELLKYPLTRAPARRLGWLHAKDRIAPDSIQWSYSRNTALDGWETKKRKCNGETPLPILEEYPPNGEWKRGWEFHRKRISAINERTEAGIQTAGGQATNGLARLLPFMSARQLVDDDAKQNDRKCSKQQEHACPKMTKHQYSE